MERRHQNSSSSTSEGKSERRVRASDAAIASSHGAHWVYVHVFYDNHVDSAHVRLLA